MDYLSIFEISATGMEYQRTRLETIASNMANANTTRTQNGRLYQPLEAVASTSAFDAAYSAIQGANDLRGVEKIEIVERNVAPKKVFDPGHPDADAQGFISMPNINPIDEMTNLMTTTRAYEANVRVLNAAKTMALRAIEIGSK